MEHSHDKFIDQNYHKTINGVVQFILLTEVSGYLLNILLQSSILMNETSCFLQVAASTMKGQGPYSPVLTINPDPNGENRVSIDRMIQSTTDFFPLESSSQRGHQKPSRISFTSVVISHAICVF